ncbi:ribonucleoside-diphosphate reductase large subunit [Caulobacter phage CcrBL10]|uniref:Ribonucleoside-diphosphate reductase n=1 Tax=Caulobacter phage CcrBL10 TaxID=2283269 RepID=A0A385EBX3_9CAUD|nr:ribonucleoside-diphosphate reductase large subunit [Caulobacter phage CcrBL10]AXQ68307.1 ribonucleotide reductase of class Ia (aerobic), alpha subunit [Caulobacter phage CcrBL10]
MAVATHEIKIDLTRDALLDDFTLQTLRERYLLPGETSPQEAFARASAAFADDAEHGQRLYDYVSNLWFMYATPLLSNGGSARGLPISCFLTAIEDSRESISEHYDEVIWLSSMGGGIGSYYGALRALGEKTSKGSQSTGVIPFMAVDDRLILAVSQGGTRRGSNAVYLDIHHPEIREFITARKPTGGDHNRKITNLHNAVNVTDEFMIAVRDDTDFALRSPKTGEVIRMERARDLWRLLIETRVQTGEPYIHFIDTSNRHFPDRQKKLGLSVRQSNLCVAGETEILTRNGHLPIASLAGGFHDVWNGVEFSNVLIHQTNATDEKAELVRVWFEDGDFVDCTPYHKFYTEAGVEVRAGELKDGTVLAKANVPVTEGVSDASPPLEVAYTAGWTTFAGFSDKNRLSAFVPVGLPDAVLKTLSALSLNLEGDEAGTTLRYDPLTINTGVVPFHHTPSRRLAWLGGALDAAGEWVEIDGVRWLTVGSTDADLIREMRLLAIESGLHPRIRLTDTVSAFSLSAWDVAYLSKIGAVLSKTAEQIDAAHQIEVAPKLAATVASVHPLAHKADVFCATEPKRNRLVFNGYLTGNCSEIMLGTGRDVFGKMRTAVCCLSSVNAEKWVEWKDHPTFIEDLMRMLDNCLQVFIDNAPDEMHRASYSAVRERSVGLGLLGFHSLLQSLDIPFESMAAETLNKTIFRHMRRKADAASLILGAERGEAPDMEGSGERFAHKLAVAPNASSSILCGGASPSIEPNRANTFLHKTLSGSFQVKNRWLRAWLASLGADTDEVWKTIVANEGSIQHFSVEFFEALGIDVDPAVLEHKKRVYKTAMELDQRWVVRLAVGRTEDICQGQSLNVFHPHDATAETLSEVTFLAWNEGYGVKSMYYLRSTTPKRAENTNTKVERKQIDMGEAPTTGSAEEAALLALNPTSDSTCVACEG